MGRSPCCSKGEMNRGAWTSLEDKLLTDYINLRGEGKWRNIPREAGLKRCGKSCRLRWLNYLRPGIKRGNISQDEEDLIIRLHKLLGNRWSLIAGRLPGRTDNEIKNYWNTILSKKAFNKQTKSSKNEKISKKVIQTPGISSCPQKENGNRNHGNDGEVIARQKPAAMTGQESDYSDGSSFSEENSSEIMLDFNIGEILNSDFMNGEGFLSPEKISQDCFQLNVDSEFGPFSSFFESAGDWFGFDHLQ